MGRPRAKSEGNGALVHERFAHEFSQAGLSRAAKVRSCDTFRDGAIACKRYISNRHLSYNVRVA